MDKNDIEKLKAFGTRLKQINSKFRLLNLIQKAKEEFDKNNYEGCIENCQKALAENPNNPTALRGLGCSMQIMGRKEEAISYYKKALEFSEHKEIEYTLIGTLYYLEENLDEALKYYNLAISSNEEYDPAYDGRNQTMLENHLKIADLQDSLIKRELF